MKLNWIKLEENHTRVTLSKLPEKIKCSNTSDVYIGTSIRSGGKKKSHICPLDFFYVELEQMALPYTSHICKEKALLHFWFPLSIEK